MKVLCGLGNPGKKYNGTRHNVGFVFIAEFAKKHEFPPFEERGKALVSTKGTGENKILLMLPLSFMNLSGEAVREVLDFYKVPLKDFYTIYDDVDLPLGTLRFREKGSAGTHNGMKSVIEHLSSMDFPRLRIGIESRGEIAPAQIALHDFVLAPFLPDELPILKKTIEEGIEILEKDLAKESIIP
ncbi:MAG: aminoacyl-tRNA hydrolase [Candidatus Gracilibacteria bacterium]|jgi:PTH1 family peptidyl-tRNA hydrolase